MLIVPLLAYLALRRFWEKYGFGGIYKKIIAGILFLIWLLFMPNAAYVITDIKHLFSGCGLNYYQICPESVWTIFFLFAYASFGWVAFVLLLDSMKNLIEKFAGGKTAVFFVFAVIPLLSLGILLGLIERWNSWDFFVSPGIIFAHIWAYGTDLNRFLNWLLTAVFLYILYFGGNYLFGGKNKP
ncbi:MAG: DUF1361 domain-containing protein [Candidatus Falkowbacteria bacterium]